VFTAVADTNIYVSAFNFKGTPAQVLEGAQEGRFRIAISDEILNEISRFSSASFCGKALSWHKSGPPSWRSLS
jgi:predicted nucleic acid-binding protein